MKYKVSFTSIILTIGLLSSFSGLSQQKDFKTLTLKEYYSDFDTLQKWISSVSPVYLVNDKLKGQNFLKEMKKLRKQIGYVHSSEDFLKIVNHSLNLLQDPHASLLTNRSFIAFSILHRQQDTSYINESCRYYDSLRNKFIRTRDIKPEFPIKYIGGQYVVYYPFVIRGVPVDTGYIVESVNGKSIHSLIKELIPDIPILKYDLVHKISYYDNFYKIRKLYDRPDSMMSISFSKGKRTVDISFRLSDTAIFDKPVKPFDYNTDSKGRKVIYFDSLGILYIRIPEMLNGNFYITEIKKLLDKKPRKIIFDVRGNGGGQDWVWASPLKLLIKDNEVMAPFFFGIRDNSFMKDGMRKWLHESVFGMDQSSFVFPLLSSSEPFYIFKTPPGNSYSADSMSMQYGGKIYILCDGYEYSSTGNFIDLAKSNDNIVTVGMPSGLFGGTEFSPLPFVLPYSKIAFRLEPTLDFKNAERVEDLYHNYIKMPYTYTISDLYNIASRSGDVSDPEFLLHKDPLFRIVSDMQ